MDVQTVRRGLWFGVVEYLYLERMENQEKAKGLSAYDATLEAMKKTKYQATISITKCESDFIEYIELDFECVGYIKKLGFESYNAFRAMWLTQYLISIRELDQDYRELMCGDSDVDWDNTSEATHVGDNHGLI
jgi:hypothetical protein